MILTDTGPLVAIFNPGERVNHSRCTALLPNLLAPLVTTLPCLTEAMYLLNEVRGWYGQSQLWQLFLDGTLVLFDIDELQMERMQSLMKKYADVPMDFADASLVVAAGDLGTRKIFTLDSDFSVYRHNGRKSFEIIP